MASIFPGHPLGRCNIYRPQRRQTLEAIHFCAGLLGQSGFKDKVARLRGSDAQRLPSLIAAGPCGFPEPLKPEQLYLRLTPGMRFSKVGFTYADHQ